MCAGVELEVTDPYPWFRKEVLQKLTLDLGTSATEPYYFDKLLCKYLDLHIILCMYTIIIGVSNVRPCLGRLYCVRLGSRERNTHSAPHLVKQRRAGLIPAWVARQVTWCQQWHDRRWLLDTDFWLSEIWIILIEARLCKKEPKRNTISGIQILEAQLIIQNVPRVRSIYNYYYYYINMAGKHKMASPKTEKYLHFDSL